MNWNIHTMYYRQPLYYILDALIKCAQALYHLGIGVDAMLKPRYSMNSCEIFHTISKSNEECIRVLFRKLQVRSISDGH